MPPLVNLIESRAGISSDYHEVPPGMKGWSSSRLEKMTKLPPPSLQLARRNKLNIRRLKKLHTTGSELLKKIERRGLSLLNRLKIDELHALLVHSDSQGHVPKPSKKQIGFEKVVELTTVKAVIFRHFANFVAATQPQPQLTAAASNSS
jgi:hypothetical protein